MPDSDSHIQRTLVWFVNSPKWTVRGNKNGTQMIEDNRTVNLSVEWVKSLGKSDLIKCLVLYLGTGTTAADSHGTGRKLLTSPVMKSKTKLAPNLPTARERSSGPSVDSLLKDRKSLNMYPFGGLVQHLGNKQ